MCKLSVNHVLKDKILVSRESARLLETAMRAAMIGQDDSKQVSGKKSLVVDFEGVEGMAPSFLDELLSIFESFIAAETEGLDRGLMVLNPPTRLSSKFEAVARGHGMSVRVMPDNSWLLSDDQIQSG